MSDQSEILIFSSGDEEEGKQDGIRMEEREERVGREGRRASTRAYANKTSCRIQLIPMP